MAIKIGLVVPVYKNFEGFADLMRTVDTPVLPIVIDNWRSNIGVSKGWNEGIRRAIKQGCDLALICNDDILFYEGTIAKLRGAVWNTGLGFDLVTPVNVRDHSLTNKFTTTENPDFSCFMIEPEKFTDKFGWFDENFSPAYFEDNDMAYRIRVAGGRYAARTDAGHFHQGSVTQNWGGQQVVTGPMFEANRAYYVAKWGGTPGNELYTIPFGGAQ